MPSKKTVRFANNIGLPLEHVRILKPRKTVRFTNNIGMPLEHMSTRDVQRVILAAPSSNAIHAFLEYYKRTYPHDELTARQIMYAYISRVRREPALV